MSESKRAEPKLLLTIGMPDAMSGFTPVFAEKNWQLEPCSSLLGAFAKLAGRPSTAVLIHGDCLPDTTIPLEEMRRVCPDAILVVLLNAPGRLEGADECLVLPCDPRQLLEVLERAYERRTGALRLEQLKGDNEQLREMVRQKREQLAVIEASVGRLGTAMADRESLFKAALDVFGEATGAQRQSFMLLVSDSSGPELRIAASRGLPKGIASQARCRLGEGVAGWVAQHGEALRHRPQSLSEQARAWAKSYNSDHFLCLPLKVGEKVIGVVNMTERVDGRAFDEDDVLALSILAEQTAVLLSHCQRFRRVHKLSLIDDLTSLYNRRYLMQGLAREIERSKRTDRPFGLAILDIDHFKVYNDTYGHPGGDRLLKQFARLLLRGVRSSDTVCRCGGDEFAIILQETGAVAPSWNAYATPFVDRIRVAASEFPFEGREALPGGRLTFSTGLAVFPRDAENLEEMIAVADEMLYEAKKSGRNCVRSRGGQTTPQAP